MKWLTDMTKYEIIRLINTRPEEPVCQVFFSTEHMKDLIYILSETVSPETVSCMATIDLRLARYLRIGKNEQYTSKYTGISLCSYGYTYTLQQYTPTSILFTKV